MQEENDDVVWGIASDGLVYHHVNAAEPKAPNGSGQKQLLLRVYLPHHELISCLQEWVNLLLICTNFNTGAVPQQKPRTMMTLCQSQRGKSTTLSTSKLHHAHCNSQLSAELSSFKFGQSSRRSRCEDSKFSLSIPPVGPRKVEF